MVKDMVTIKAYAKINWFLDIRGIRADGYHELSTLMQKISLADEISISFAEPIREGTTVFHLPKCTLYFSIESKTSLVPDEKNTIVRALAYYLEVGTVPGTTLYVHLKKAIPIQGGLGGGSSDAAAFLRALNERSPEPLTEERLAEIALRVGADVPFCLQKAPLAYCTGIGEICEPISEAPSLPLLLLLPGLRVSTGVAFASYDALEMEDRQQIPLSQADEFVEELLGERERLESFGQNTFSFLHRAQHPELGQYEAHLRAVGASYAAMSGSGPTLFALFRSEEERELAKAALAKAADIQVLAVSTLGEMY